MLLFQLPNTHLIPIWETNSVLTTTAVVHLNWSQLSRISNIEKTIAWLSISKHSFEKSKIYRCGVKTDRGQVCDCRGLRRYLAHERLKVMLMITRWVNSTSKQTNKQTTCPSSWPIPWVTSRYLRLNYLNVKNAKLKTCVSILPRFQLVIISLLVPKPQYTKMGIQ